MDSRKVERSAREVAAEATCRSVDSAIVAYVGERGVPPRSVTELRDYVKGDVAAYRIVGGRAAGPGC